ncbi:hypothetical protein SAV31267_075760 [Streptomyces avermitilis]|uniref:Uncharacterized protein n=1 Tax=Streptomyces avermitilis TaxID=33903 RepID=A0A4D4N0T6_STRAX|nr:hypothetical protein SAV31267_075760 [Streptomyces avermitilis]
MEADGQMDRGRCGPLVVARNAPGIYLRGAQEFIGDYELTCAVTRLEKVVRRV